MPFAENKGVRLHWQAEGEGTPILLIMGLSYSAAMWYPVIPALAAKHRVISFDNRGVGQSGMTRKTSIADLVDDALTVMDAAGVDRAHIFGVSMGGGIALELGIRAPERARSLILGCTCIKSAEKPSTPAWVRQLYRLPPWVFKLLTPKPGPDRGYGSAAPEDAIVRDLAMVAKDKRNVSGVIAQAGAIADYVNSKEKVAAVKLPALVLHGDEDRTVPFEWGVELAETLPGSQFVRFEGAGHNFFVAGGQRANDVVLDFVDAVDRRAATEHA